MSTTKEILDFITSLYPLENASDFDKGKIGMQFGSYNAKVEKVVLALDTTKEVVDEAIELGANLIISHHPFMFAPLVNLNYDTPFGKKLTKVFENKLNIMAFHTNYDVGENGMNDVLAEKLGLTDIHYLTSEINNDSFVRVGSIEECTLKDFCEIVKKVFDHPTVRCAGNLEKKIKKVAIVGGSGSTEFFQALRSDADCFVTGQVPHHLGIEAVDNDFGLIEVSHAIEFYGIENLQKQLKEAFPEIEFVITKTNQEPFKFI